MKIIKNLYARKNRKLGEIELFLSQFLTGYGQFQQFSVIFKIWIGLLHHTGHSEDMKKKIYG